MLGLISAASLAAHAHATGYNSEAAWRAAVGTFTLDDFESYAPNTQIQNDVPLGITFDLLNDAVTYPSVQLASQTGGPGPISGTRVLLNDLDFALPPRGPFKFSPTNPLDQLWGAGVWNVGGDDTIRLAMYDANNQLIEQFDSPAGSGFVGIALSSPAARAEIFGIVGNEYIPVDDLQVSLRRIPEPGTMLLCLAAGTAMLMSRRPKRRSALR
jgi:hypothetical protein